MFDPYKELLHWVQKGDKNFYNEALAGVNPGLFPYRADCAYRIEVPSTSDNPHKVWVPSELEPVITAIGHALGVWWSEGLAGQEGVRQLGRGYGYMYSVPIRKDKSHAVLAKILGVRPARADTLAAEIKASLGIEFHCYSRDGKQWLA